MPYQFSSLNLNLTFSPGEFPCPNRQCPTKFYVEIPLLVQNTRTRTTLPATISQPTRDLLVGQCYACQERICLLCLNTKHVSSQCEVTPCSVALDKFREAWGAFEKACPTSIRARHEGSIEERVMGDLDVWDAMMLVHQVRLREARFKELEEEGDGGSFVSVGDSEMSWEEETEETEEEKEARVWEGLRRELRDAYEVLMEGCKCSDRN
ncbi:hypothetical protein B9Z19DRAFT_1172306 [Tuber borchii]|uniref:Uncharacterized protein n=1 Tax=Tuber borchii TaxID=42251 RepID=A0A2T6ZXT7_TUBBO|nr:hypothetical protein B9Z19DRAFT_1172306 [Tuber borchii]